MERFQRSPEELLSDTLNDLMENYRELKQNLNDYSQSVRNLKTAGTQQKFPDSLQDLKDQSIEHFKEMSNSYQDYSNLMETFQGFFETYRSDFEYWLTKESHLQRSSEDFKPTGDKIIEKLEHGTNTFKKSVEQAMKAISEAQETLSIHQEVMEKSNQHNPNVSCSCILLWLPRKVRRGCESLARKYKPPKREQSSSYENLVLQKENQNTKTTSTTASSLQISINDTEKLLKKFSAVVSTAAILISSMYVVSNGMSYIHQELCRLDYLDANKEKHFEIVSKHSDTVIKVISLVYSGLTIAQSESLKIVKTGYDEHDNGDDEAI